MPLPLYFQMKYEINDIKYHANLFNFKLKVQFFPDNKNTYIARVPIP